MLGSRGDVEPRARLYRALVAFPGLHLAALAREAGVDEPLARYHVRVLSDRGLADEIADQGTTRYFPRTPSPVGPRENVDRADKPALALLRRPVPLRMVVALLVADGGRLTMGELATAGGVAASTATYHLRSLERAGLVIVEVRGRERHVRLADPARAAGLLARYPPPNDLVQGFLELWDRLEL